MHAVAQAPQWVGSLARSTHALPQRVVPAGHTQTPALQLVPPAQALPHAPQWSPLEPRSTHAPLHTLRPAPQVVAHTPALHT